MKRLLLLTLSFSLVLSPAWADKAKAPAKAAPAKAAPAKAAPAKKAAPASRPSSRAAAQDLAATPGQDKGETPGVGSHLEYLVKSGVIRVCVRTDIPPFGHFQGNMLTGFDVALAKEIVTVLGIKYNTSLSVRWVIVKAGDRIKSLQEGRCDMATAAFSVTEKRKKKVSFSLVYIQTRKVILSRLQVTAKQPVVAVVSGATAKKAAIKNGREVSFYTYDDILDTMKKNLVDYVITDHPTGLYLTRNSTGYIVDRVLKQSEDYGVGVHKQHDQLLRAINSVISELAKNGRLAYLKRKFVR